MGIKKFILSGWEYGYIKGVDGQHIIVTDDLIHYVGKYDPEELRSGWDEFTKISVAEIEAQSVDVEWSDFVRYWGIKERIRGNYYILQHSMKEIGADTSGMPEWGA